MYVEVQTVPIWKSTPHVKKQPKSRLFYFWTNRSPLAVPDHCVKDKMIEGTIKPLNIFSSEVILLSSQENVCRWTHFISQDHVSDWEISSIEISFSQKSKCEISMLEDVSQREGYTLTWDDFQPIIVVNLFTFMRESKSQVDAVEFGIGSKGSVKVEIFPPKFLLSIVKVQFDFVCKFFGIKRPLLFKVQPYFKAILNVMFMILCFNNWLFNLDPSSHVWEVPLDAELILMNKVFFDEVILHWGEGGPGL